VPRRTAVFALFIFIVLFAEMFPFGDIPLTGFIARWMNNLWGVVVPWVADHLVRPGFDVRQSRTGGEPLREFIRVGCAGVVAVVAGSAWALFDRRRTNARRVHEWLRLYLRLFLIAQLFSYGLDKVIPNQFGPLGPVRLSETFGEASPSTFLWAFMGYSVPYQVFAGMGETLAGALLCFRKTTTLGALIGAAVMLNVVMLNYSFDVGVKLHSTFYLCGLLYLAAPDIQRVLDVFVLNRRTAPKTWPAYSSVPWRHRTVVVASGLLCAFLFVSEMRLEWDAYVADGRRVGRPGLYGLYDVEWFRRNGATMPPVATDSALWSRLAIEDGRSSIRLASGSVTFFVSHVDTATQRVRFVRRGDTSDSFALAYSRPDSGHLILGGRLGQDSIEMRLVRRNEMAYPLMQRRFRWTYDHVENR